MNPQQPEIIDAARGEAPGRSPGEAPVPSSAAATATATAATATVTTATPSHTQRRRRTPLRRMPYRVQTWVVPLLISLFGGLIRFIRLDYPHQIMFDETYYVKDTWSMMMTGEARDWPKYVDGVHIDTLFAQGQTYLHQDTAEYIVHPPMGKWLMAIGMELFGGASSSFAWRASSAIAGTIAILLICRVALRMFHNLTIAAFAGLLMSVDGVAISMSRIGILDNLIMVLVLGAFLCLLNHRDWALAKLRAAHERDVAIPGMVVRTKPLKPRERRGEGGDQHAAAGQPSVRLVVRSSGPVVAFSWWRVGAVVLLGLATGVKWSGTYFFAAFALLSVLWDGYNRHQVGYRRWFGATIAKDGLLAALYMVPLYIGMYFVDWLNWFIHPDSYMHDWAAKHPGQGITWLPEGLRSFVEYHITMWKFHTTLTSPHAYKANPLTWPLQIRPTSFHWNKLEGHPGLCAVSPDSQCVSAVTSLGNPVLWWFASACLVLTLIMGLIARRGDWRVLAVWAGLAGGWMPWWLYIDRTTFTFYSIVILPWMILAICYVFDWVRSNLSQFAFRWISTGVLTLIMLVSVYFLPLWTGMPIPYQLWLQHMWLHSWI